MRRLTIYDIGKAIGIILMGIAIIAFAYFMINGATEINIWMTIGLFWLGSSTNWQSAYYEVVKDEK
jgi:hypothetical protein